VRILKLHPGTNIRQLSTVKVNLLIPYSRKFMKLGSSQSQQLQLSGL